jgi:hypothetical protein
MKGHLSGPDGFDPIFGVKNAICDSARIHAYKLPALLTRLVFFRRLKGFRAAEPGMSWGFCTPKEPMKRNRRSATVLGVYEFCKIAG